LISFALGPSRICCAGQRGCIRLPRRAHVAHDHRRTRSTFCRQSEALDNRAPCRETSAGARADTRQICLNERDCPRHG
jgi:hypothetical protein